MFLNYLKHISAKLDAKNRLAVAPPNLDFTRVESIGLVVDAVRFPNYGQLLQQLRRSGLVLHEENILVYSRQKIAGKSNLVFNESDLGWKGELKSGNLTQFAAKPFDVLINYFDANIPALQAVSKHSRAHFKIGFTSVAPQINHLMIETTVDKYQTFTAEMLRYLTVLNKL